MSQSNPVIIIGGGLAGSEAAWQLASRDVFVKLYEMRGVKTTQAHITDHLAELVCSNSFRSDDVTNAVGLLHEEMRRLDSLIMKCADAHKVPAGSALAVDRHAFSAAVQQALESHPLVEICRAEYTSLDFDSLGILATGPLTSETLASQLQKITGEEYLAFFDAIAPIVYKDSINFDIAWMQSRYDKGDGQDYINCPMEKDEYYAFIDALKTGEKTEFKEWEKSTPYFNGCLPIEVMADRGQDVLRFGPMKPVGLTNPKTGKRAYAVVQLRQDNKLGSLYNIVGFQTKLKYAEQKRVFQMIPALENAEFARLGGLHRNTFINSPKVLDHELRLKNKPNIRVAGQITGVEGYLESAAVGMITGMMTAFEYKNASFPILPKESALGSLHAHITENANSDTFQPMNINYGLFPELNNKLRGDDKKSALSHRALSAIDTWSALQG
ncbi:MAG: methylenetetrahydrofolate--tRNA-(uracil(54)-C(5))-methyltransferase (FADH(2)-oxidizing) TrmFO [Candidatus Jidaibacter sp.]|jgi:methylenetetrahydrofolate--tRNA-(uracil-5-)-methyltransferase|nr:methylenetetrahydrofolate--tRNA-(uracil(54)-C(5))-methyltransferase (FADH(2)-oxidizing) TrmFO [Candidatus Jidaibacter sp.]